jgi:nitrite reductase/ring-hydroxylating ferredoxin subunit
VDGRPLLVHRSADALRVYEARCPHQWTFLGEDAVHGSRVICPRHGWEFDLEDGRCIEGSAPLKQVPHEVSDGELLAFW